MVSFKPIGLSIAFVLFMGLIFPFLLGFFISVDNVQTTPLINSTINFLDDGFEVDILGIVDFDVNPFFWVPDDIMNYITDSFVYLSLLPEFLIIFFLVLISVSFVYTVVALVRGS